MTCEKCGNKSLNSYTNITVISVEDGKRTGKEQAIVCPKCGTLIIRYISRYMGGK